jgi:DNA-directed RNA polymerase subunit M
MKFCPKCGSLLKIEEIREKRYFVCPNCRYREEAKRERMIVSERIPKDEKKKVVLFKKGEELEQFPITKISCPSCGNNEAYWWVQQTRSADEPPTTFYKCRKCGYTWRSYG